MPVTMSPDTPLNQVRLAIGDTAAEYIADSVITSLLTAYSDDVAKASLAALDIIIAELCKLADETTDEVSVKYSQKLANYRQLKDDLSSDSVRSSPNSLFLIGGTIKSKNDAFYSDSGVVKSPVRAGDCLRGTYVLGRNPDYPFYIRD